MRTRSQKTSFALMFDPFSLTPKDWAAFRNGSNPCILDGNRRATEPFLENDQAKQDLMVVALALHMFLHQLPYCSRPQVLVNRGTVVGKNTRHGSPERIPEPAVHDIARETAF